MKLFFFIISFLFCVLMFTDNRVSADLPGGQEYVVDATIDLDMEPAATICIETDVLKFLTTGEAMITEGKSPPSKLSRINYLTSHTEKAETINCTKGIKDANSQRSLVNLVITPIMRAEINPKETAYYIKEDRSGYSSGGSSGNYQVA